MIMSLGGEILDMHGLFNDAISISEYVACSGQIINSEFKSKLREAVITEFEVLTQH